MDMKEEAIQRMKILKLHPNVIAEFEKEGTLNKSELPIAKLIWLTEEEKELVKDEEKQNNFLVYHIIKTLTTDFGIVYDLLYVEENSDDWEIDKEDLKNDLVLSHTITEFQESGLIKIKKINGGLVRVC